MPPPPTPSSPALATTTRPGLMSAADKVALDAVSPADQAPPEIADSSGAVGTETDYAREGHTHAHGNRGGGSLHAAAVASGASGFLTGADKAKLDGIPASSTPTTRTLTAGAGMTGGGDLSADRTFNVIANVDGSIAVNADDIQVGILASDAQHGARGGGTQHANAIAAGAAGFMTGSDKTKLDGLPTSAVPTSRTITAGAGLTGTGDLSADRTLTVGANVDGSITVNADDIQVGILASDAQHGVRGGGTQHANAVAAGAAGFLTGADKTKLDGVASGATNTPLSNASPADTGTTAAGVSSSASRDDHTHALPAVGPGATTTGTAGVQGVQTDAAGRVLAVNVAPGAGYATALTGAQTAYYQTFKASGIDLLATGQTLVVPSISSKRVIPRDVSIRLTAVTGIVIIAPVVRAGNNGSFNNISPLHTLTGAAAQDVDEMALNTQIAAVDVGSTGISLDVQTGGTGASVLTGEVVIGCLVV